MNGFHCRVNFMVYGCRLGWLYVRKQTKKRRMNGLRKRKKLSAVQPFYVYARGSYIASYLIYVRKAS